MLYQVAKERSDEEKKEIYDKWKGLINMSEKELVEWGEDPDHLEASLNRQEAKQNGKIQSGYDSFHRIKRRKDKPFEDWTAQDFDNASQENGFNGRMLGGNPGKPVGSTGMSKWEISLRNWGHDPSKPNSPSYTKWKKWKKENEEQIKMSLAKKKKANLISDLYKMSFKVKGGENLRRACLMCLNTKRASAVNMIDFIPPEKEASFKFDLLVTRLDEIMKSIKSKVGLSLDVLKTFLQEKGVFNGKNLLSMKVEKPANFLQELVSSILWAYADDKDPHSLLQFTSDLIKAETPEDIAKAVKMPLKEIGNYLGEGVEDKGNKMFSYIASMDTLKFFAVKVSFSLLKMILFGLAFGATFAATLAASGKIVVVILIMSILLNAKTTANLLKKVGIGMTTIPSVLFLRMWEKLTNNGKQLISKAYGKFTSMFSKKQAVLREAVKLAQINPQFKQMLENRI